MATTEPTIYCWELHNTRGGSDKYYRFLVIGRVVLANYGRRGQDGQVHAYVTASEQAATDKARTLTNNKANKGYVLTRDMTEVVVTQQQHDALSHLPPGRVTDTDAIRACLKTVELFKETAQAQGTATPGAGR